MNDILIIKIVFGIFLTLGGIVLIFLSYKLGYKYLIQEKRCTSKTKGIIRRYTFVSYGGEYSGVHLPVVFYTANGKEYKVVGPEYKKYVRKIKSTPLSENKTEYDVLGETFYLNQTVNSYIGMKTNPIRNLYPLDTEIDVYYDPTNPKLAYVLRYCNKKYMFYLMFIAGVLVLITDILILICL